MHITPLPAFCTIISPVHCSHPCPSQSPSFSWSLFATKGSSLALGTSLPSLQSSLGPSSSPLLYVSTHFFSEPSWRISPHGKPYLSFRAKLKGCFFREITQISLLHRIAPLCYLAPMWHCHMTPFSSSVNCPSGKIFDHLWDYLIVCHSLSGMKWGLLILCSTTPCQRICA